MKFGVREICDVVFRAKSARKIGSRQFYKNEPVLYFDTLKTSSLEGAVTTVYATGGRGNARLVAWDGERTLTFTMEDALISDIGIAILVSADLISAKTKPIVVHATSMVTLTEYKAAADGKGATGNATIAQDNTSVDIYLTDESGKEIIPYINGGEDLIYVMLTKDGEPVSEPFIATGDGTNKISIKSITAANTTEPKRKTDYEPDTLKDLAYGDTVLIDYYVQYTEGVTQVDIAPETFGGNFYIEASTLFRDQVTGVDMPAEFIIPNGKVQSNFTFTMASSGDPSTFTFTVDALPDYTRFNPSKKVLAAIQIVTENASGEEYRSATDKDGEYIKYVETPATGE